MKRKTILFLLSFLLTNYVIGQELTLKEAAVEEFKKEHYKEAIRLLEKAVVENPNDAEIYYYLGWYNHYLAYDSRPLKGYNFEHSEKIFSYLEKALELNPDYGDAKYFYGAECSGNAFNAMQNYDLDKLRYFYKKAYDKGAYPAWLIELGKNLLNSCADNSILFVGGNADFDICSYLQLHQDFRKDITVIPIGNIDRPWYVEFLKTGLQNGVKPITLSLTKNQIYDIHPFKWDSTLVEIPVSHDDIKKYKLKQDYKLKWQVNPDLFSQRQHSKMQDEEVKNRTYLSPQRAILLQIVEENLQNRPIYFSNFCNPFFYGSLDKFITNCGLVSKLTPVNTKEKGIQNDYFEMERLLKEENLKHYSEIVNYNIPRISGITFTYHRTLYLLALMYSENNKTEKLNTLIKLYKSQLQVGFNEKVEQYFKEELVKMKIP